MGNSRETSGPPTVAVGRLARVLMVVALAVSAAACSGGDDDVPDAGDSDSGTAPVPLDEPDDGGEVRLVDQGFTVIPGPGIPGAVYTPEAIAAGEDSNIVSWGVVVENTSEWVAIVTEIHVELLDADGADLPVRHWSGETTVTLIPPGDRFGLGHTSEVEGGSAVVPTSLEVEIGTTRWLPPDANGVDLTGLRVSSVSIARPSPVDDFEITYDVELGAAEGRPFFATSVLRNAAGEIVGGTSRYNDNGDVAQPVVRGYPTLIELEYTVPNVDDATSDVYLDPESLPLPRTDVAKG